MKENQESYEALWNRALWYLGRRDYGAQELRRKLLRPRPNNKPVPSEEDADRAIERLLELNLLDDARYAKQLTESLSRKGHSARAIAFELKKRGVQEEAEPELDDSARIAQLLQGKYAARLGDERGRRAVYQALLRRGFRSADISRGMKDCAQDMPEGDYDGDF